MYKTTFFATLLILFALISAVVVFAAPVEPLPVNPGEGAFINDPNISLEWTSSGANITKYVIKLRSQDRTQAFKFKALPAELGCDGGGNCVFQVSDVSWTNATTYQWKVVAKSHSGKVKTSWAAFTTDFPVPGAFNLLAPADYASVDTGSNPTFSWNPTNNTDFYKIKVMRAGVKIWKAKVEAANCGETCSVTMFNTLTGTGNYAWKVVAKNTYGKSKSSKFHLTVMQSDAYAQQLLDLVNEQRCAEGLAPLALNAKLTAAAKRHSEDMAANNFFDHEGSDGSKMSDRIRDAGYSFSSAAENIAAGSTSVDFIFELWWGSQGHHDNIMRANLREMGVSMVTRSGTQYGTYWTQTFGSRNSTILGTCP